VNTAVALHGRRITIGVEHPLLVPLVNRLFRPYSVTTGARTEPDYRVGGDSAAGWWVAGGSRGRTAFETAAQAVDDLEYRLTLHLLGFAADHPHLHASGAVIDGRAVLAVGPSGAGKSSLALAWSTSGYRVLGDDIALLERHGRVTPFARLFGVPTGLLSACGVPADEDLDPLAGDGESWFDPARAGGWADPDPIPVAIVAAIRHRADPATVIRDLPASEIVALLVGSLLESGRPPADSFDAISELAVVARGVHVTYGDPANASAALAAAV